MWWIYVTESMFQAAVYQYLCYAKARYNRIPVYLILLLVIIIFSCTGWFCIWFPLAGPCPRMYFEFIQMCMLKNYPLLIKLFAVTKYLAHVGQ